jgi:hypothetical protein
MVMQSKVFIVTLLQRFEPQISKKRTFIRRVKDSIHRGHHRDKSASQNSASDLESGMTKENTSGCCSSVFGSEIFPGKTDKDLTTSEAMRLFTKIPFPEPRVILHVYERESNRCQV